MTHSGQGELNLSEPIVIVTQAWCSSEGDLLTSAWVTSCVAVRVEGAIRRLDPPMSVATVSHLLRRQTNWGMRTVTSLLKPHEIPAGHGM